MSRKTAGVIEMGGLPVTRSGDLAGDRDERIFRMSAARPAARWGRGEGERSACDWRSRSPRSSAASAASEVGGEGEGGGGGRHRRRLAPTTTSGVKCGSGRASGALTSQPGLG
jgi:hypothetical protein